MKKFISNQHGFTLVEVIISIAILSVASLVVLQLFITSVTLNEESRHSDIASVLATNALENLSSMDSIDEMLSNFDAMVGQGDDFIMSVILDEDFQVMDDVNKDTTMANYALIMALTTTDHPGLYKVSVNVTDLLDETPLVSYGTSHYFKKEVGLYDKTLLK